MTTTFTIQGASGGQKTQPAKTDTLLLQETGGGSYKYGTLDDLGCFPLRYQSVADSAAIASTASETAFDKAFTVPANYFRAGMRIRVAASGEFSNTGTPALTLRVRVGGVAGLLLASFDFTTTTQTSKQWSLLAEAVARTIGASGSFAPGFGTCYLYGSTPLGNRTSSLVTVDTTASKSLCVTAQWGASSASNTIFARSVSIEIALPSS